jgi:hypothetical protein
VLVNNTSRRCISVSLRGILQAAKRVAALPIHPV